MFRSIPRGNDQLSTIVLGRLPETLAEVRQIAQIWKKTETEPVYLFTGAQASEETLKREYHNKRILHFATHGYNFSLKSIEESLLQKSEEEHSGDEENPLLLSGLFLAGANLHGKETDKPGVEDGIVSAEEVMNMNLEGTDLVVLSACETGLGKLQTGEGAYGLRRAFQMAGAHTVISALWPVSDQSTAKLMEKLYSNQTNNLPELMRNIALERIAEIHAAGQPDHPVNWAGFIAMGDWRTN